MLTTGDGKQHLLHVMDLLLLSILLLALKEEEEEEEEEEEGDTPRPSFEQHVGSHNPQN